MKLPGYCPRGGYIPPEKVPFKEMRPLSLRNIVSGKGDQAKAVACLQEMSVFLACLKRNDFDDKKCPAEVAFFQNCNAESAAKAREVQERDRKGGLVPGEKRLSHKQANELLKRFPGPRQY